MQYSAIQHNIISYILECLENNYNGAWIKLLSTPSPEDTCSFVIAVDPFANLLTDKLELSNNIIIGTYRNTYQCIEMLQTKQLEVGYIIARDNDKNESYRMLCYAIRKIIIDLYVRKS